MMQQQNPYLEQIRWTLPRLLALFDRDITSASHGIGDRYYWAWGLIDFPNATYQGAAHGLASLWRSRLWPHGTTPEQFALRMSAIFEGARSVTRADGSCEEAFPYEGSYCVTALVAFDLINAITQLSNVGVAEPKLNEWQATIEPMVEFLKASDETHAVISNHLATAAAALNRWELLTGDVAAGSKARLLLDRILDHQSDEGWFEEYGGPDPGYESLCLHYLADVHETRPDLKLLEPLRRSVRFLWHFAHPDGSFGGAYGSRFTRFYYPSGILALSSEIEEADALARYMERSIAQKSVVTLVTMDDSNLVPMFNSYCRAAALTAKSRRRTDPLTVPCQQTKPMRRAFPDSGLLIDRGRHHYTIIATKKGGAVCHFPTGAAALHDYGIVVRDPQGRLGSTLVSNRTEVISQHGDTLRLQASVCQMTKRLPNVFYFLLLRLMCVSVLRFPRLREWTKQFLARWLITSIKAWPARNIRTLRLGHDLVVEDDPTLPDRYTMLDGVNKFVPVHMASQGYWQTQDEEVS
jgi:hypothetical protein